MMEVEFEPRPVSFQIPSSKSAMLCPTHGLHDIQLIEYFDSKNEKVKMNEPYKMM